MLFFSEKYVEVYNCQFQLARYFQSTSVEDKWLADHFFARCLATSLLVQDDDGRHAAQGHCNVGLSLEESGEYCCGKKEIDNYLIIRLDSASSNYSFHPCCFNE